MIFWLPLVSYSIWLGLIRFQYSPEEFDPITSNSTHI